MNKRVQVVQKVLQANDLVAAENRKLFHEAGVLAVNLISSPGSGKTFLLEQTIQRLAPQEKGSVIVGDLETTRDADRLAPYCREVIQVNTGMSCHLYANQVAQSARGMDLKDCDYLFIENVGNMVCPGEFDLGENIKVILLSTPEGDDKVAKYPTIFRVADAVLLTKIDLLAHLPFDKSRVMADMKKLNSRVTVFELSAKTGEGMGPWIAWLKEKRRSDIGKQAKCCPA